MKKLNLTDKRNPDYFYSEAIKTLRTNIQLSGQSIKTILVTSISTTSATIRSAIKKWAVRPSATPPACRLCAAP